LKFSIEHEIAIGIEHRLDIGHAGNDEFSVVLELSAEVGFGCGEAGRWLRRDTCVAGTHLSRVE
jgi:hypothetical protein